MEIDQDRISSGKHGCLYGLLQFVNHSDHSGYHSSEDCSFIAEMLSTLAPYIEKRAQTTITRLVRVFNEATAHSNRVEYW